MKFRSNVVGEEITFALSVEFRAEPVDGMGEGEGFHCISFNG